MNFTTAPLVKHPNAPQFNNRRISYVLVSSARSMQRQMSSVITQTIVPAASAGQEILIILTILHLCCSPHVDCNYLSILIVLESGWKLSKSASVLSSRQLSVCP